MKRIRLVDLTGKEVGNFDIPPDGTPHPAVHTDRRLYVLEHNFSFGPQDQPAVRTYRECEPLNVEQYAEQLEEGAQDQQQQQRQEPERAAQPAGTGDGAAAAATAAQLEAEEDAAAEAAEERLAEYIEKAKTADAPALAELDRAIRADFAGVKTAGDLLPLWAAAVDGRTAELADDKQPTKDETLAAMAKATSRQQLRDAAAAAKIEIPDSVDDSMKGLTAHITAELDKRGG